MTLDIFVSPTKDNIAKLQHALKGVFDDPHIDEITAEDLLGDYPAVQYVPPEGTLFIDILTRLEKRSPSTGSRPSVSISTASRSRS